MAIQSNVDVYSDFDPRSPRWYVVTAEPNRERVALASLRGEGFSAYLPMRAVENKTRTHATPLFPRYLFVRLDLDDASWWRVFTSHGVSSVITQTRSSGRPLPVPLPRGAISRIRAEEIDGLILLKNAAKAKAAPPFQPGDRVRIKGGVFLDFQAVFQRGDANRIAVMLSMLGSDRMVHLPTQSVEAVTAAKAR